MDRNEPGTLLISAARRLGFEEFMDIIEIPNASPAAIDKGRQFPEPCRIRERASRDARDPEIALLLVRGAARIAGQRTIGRLGITARTGTTSARPLTGRSPPLSRCLRGPSQRGLGNRLVCEARTRQEQRDVGGCHARAQIKDEKALRDR